MIGALLSDSRATLIYMTADVCVIESADRSLAEELLMGSSGGTRVFEEYYLASTGEDKAQGVLVCAFFNWLADRYNDEIEPSRNVACYEDLYDIASSLRGSAGATAVLDVGCGPGTILRSRVSRTARVLVGFDLSEVAAKTPAALPGSLLPMERCTFVTGSSLSRGG